MDNIKTAYFQKTPTNKMIYAKQYYLRNRKKKKDYYNDYYKRNKNYIKHYNQSRKPKLPQVFSREWKEVEINLN